MSNTEKRLQLLRHITDSANELLGVEVSTVAGLLHKFLIAEVLKLQVEALRLEHDLEKDIEGGGKDAEKEGNNSR